MNRTQWKAFYHDLRLKMMLDYKTRQITRQIMTDGRDFDIRITRYVTPPSIYHAPYLGLRICRPTIKDRPTSQRWAEEMQTAAIDRELARKSRHPLDRRAYKAGLEHARAIRSAEA